MKNSCIVKVTNPNSSPAKGVKVGYEVGGSLGCVGGGTSGYTNNIGVVAVTWSYGCKCNYIYIEGKSQRGPFQNGGFYTFVR